MFTLLLALVALSQAAGNCQTGFDCSACVVCSRTRNINDEKKEISLDFSTCKNSAISWACVKDHHETTCGEGFFGETSDTPLGTKCDETTHLTVVVDKDEESVTVQLHDGQANGNVDCGGRGHPNCCGGGNSGDCTGVCSVVVDLSKCPHDGCEKDSDCASLTAHHSCRVGKCNVNTHECETVPAESGTFCRFHSGLPCDETDTCDGENMVCPDIVQPNGHICRKALLPCDVDEVCDGTAKTCPEDAVQPQGTPCRQSRGKCDPADVCDGTTKECVDIYSQTAYLTKCGLNYDYCGPVDVTSPTFRVADIGLTKGGNNYLISCIADGRDLSIGRIGSFSQQPYPGCLDRCIAPQCNGGRQQDISNFLSATCVYSETGQQNFVVDYKYEFADGTISTTDYCGAQPAADPVTVC